MRAKFGKMRTYRVLSVQPYGENEFHKEPEPVDGGWPFSLSDAPVTPEPLPIVCCEVELA